MENELSWLRKLIAQPSLQIRLNDWINLVYTKHFASSHVCDKGDEICPFFFIYIFGGVETSRSGCESKVIDNNSNKMFTGWKQLTFCFVFFGISSLMIIVLKGVKWRFTTAKEEIKRFNMVILYSINKRG